MIFVLRGRNLLCEARSRKRSRSSLVGVAGSLTRKNRAHNIASSFQTLTLKICQKTRWFPLHPANKEDNEMKLPNLVIASGLLLFLAQDALADNTFILATGRRDTRIYAIDFDAALKARNNNTPNAIVSRSKVHADRLDGTPVGDPANIVLSEDRRTAYVINHHGAVNNAEFLQHGGRGSVSVMNVQKMLDPRSDNTDAALEHSFDSGYFGAVGLLILPDVLLVSHSENWLTEDGSNRISLIDRMTGSRVGQIEMTLGHPGHACPAFPVPFVSPTPPPVVPFLGPDPQFGCWPDPEFLALGNGSDGKTYLFSGNAGTNDVSVMDLHQALTGVRVVEIAP